MSTVLANVAKSIYSDRTQSSFLKFISANQEFSGYNSPNYCILPGFCDVHVHFREPGYFYKETIKTGSLAAAHGGYTDVCTMPNLSPVPDCKSGLDLQKSIIDIDSVINVIPYGSITKGLQGKELSDMEKIAKKVVGFSDDGKGVQSDDMMRSAMIKAKELGKVISAHCEDNTLLFGGYIHDGEYCRKHFHKGISSESEWRMIERDIALAKETGCAYHVCHISCKESVNLIRKAKAEGVDITCETAPHYLVLDESDLQEDGRFKMNPPLRSREDREALIEALKDGTIDMIATDHAPHSAREKGKGLEESAFGVVGLETAFPVLYTNLCKSGIISLEKLIELMCTNPRNRFNLPLKNSFSVWDLNYFSSVNPEDFLSKGKSTPFERMSVYGKCALTVCSSRVAYSEKHHYN